jgi:ParB-like nuclease domain
MQIDNIGPDKLRPYPNNARTHSQKQIRQIAKSIERFGFCNPVLVDDNNQIVAGHGRVAAAKLLGLDSVPVVRLSHLSEAEKRAYILADNKLAERAGWDRELLAIELQGLIDLKFEIDLTGFETAEVDFILDDGREAGGTQTGAEDDTPAYADGVAVSRVHDLWALGNHRLLCADPREQASYDVLLEGQKAQFVFTDPLHNVAIDGKAIKRYKGSFTTTHGRAFSGAVAGIIFGVSERTFPMMTTPRARQIVKLVADHIAADPATKWIVKVWRLPNDWSIWLLRDGVLYEYDMNLMRT